MLRLPRLPIWPQSLISTRTMATLDASPPTNRWMKDTLVRDAFHKELTVLAARVPPAKTGSMLKAKAMKMAIIDLPKIKSVVPDPANPQGDRLLLLRVANQADLAPEAQDYLKAESAEFTTYKLELDYDYWGTDEILHSILPEELCEGSPSGFAMTGHLAHMNLNAEYLPYKHIIGQVVMDKNKKIKTVVNKLDSIHTTFRFFKMELIAGEPDYIVQHHESDCRFTFDFTEVYWNSRLHTEHDRLVTLFKPEDVVADVFAGVGPFAVPAAKKGCAVFANDLNPNSAKYLAQNVEDNKVTSNVRVTCEDGRDYIKAVVLRSLDDPFSGYAGPRLSSREQQKQRRRAAESGATSQLPLDATPPPTLPPPRARISHFVMNLPDSAITFLDAFRGILAPSSLSGKDVSKVYDIMPMVHCHCFTRELDVEKAEADIRQRVEAQLGHALGEETTFHLVRSVAPNKEMYCISFRLPHEVAFSTK